MLIQHQSRSVNGLHMYLGANLKPFDPRSMKYHFATAISPRAVDLSQVRGIFSWKFPNQDTPVDLRPEIENQGPIGACACFSAIGCARCAGRAAGIPAIVPMLSGDRLYDEVRTMEGTPLSSDSGSSPDDALNILMHKGEALESEDPEQNIVASNYPDIGTLDTSSQIWLASYHPFWSTDDVLGNIWTSLDQGMPVEAAFFWAGKWFNPDQYGVVDASVTQAEAEGGHAFYGSCIFPNSALAQGVPPLPGGGGVLYENQWTPDWNINVVRSGAPGARRGAFIIPWAAHTNGAASVGMGWWSVQYKQLVQPQPQPVVNTDAYVRWLPRVSTYMGQVSEAQRATEAQAIMDTTRSFYPGVTLRPSPQSHLNVPTAPVPLTPENAGDLGPASGESEQSTGFEQPAELPQNPPVALGV